MSITKLISVNLPESYIKILELLVAEGKFPNRSEAIRVGVRDLIKTEYLIEDSIKERLDENSINSHVKSELSEEIFV
ncbi:MAG: ribbon-helix-helix protein, CopG family [Candidatus Lokiarchaeota archaeon]|nr:ribbon-helix-helix protein, CopG family [Candidatus Lokiarchaeota archaeon]